MAGTGECLAVPLLLWWPVPTLTRAARRLRGDVSARDSAHELQQDLRCCGFGSMEDRPINPCPKVRRMAAAVLRATPPSAHNAALHRTTTRQTNGERLALPGCRAELFGTVSRQLEALAVLAVAVAALQVGAWHTASMQPCGLTFFFPQALGLVVSWQLAGAREANAIAAPGKTVEDTL